MMTNNLLFKATIGLIIVSIESKLISKIAPQLHILARMIFSHNLSRFPEKFTPIALFTPACRPRIFKSSYPQFTCSEHTIIITIYQNSLHSRRRTRGVHLPPISLKFINFPYFRKIYLFCLNLRFFFPLF